MLDSELWRAMNAPGPSSFWEYFTALECWLWQARPVAYDADLDIVKQLTTAGFERIDSEHYPARLTALYGQLADVVTLVWPGAGNKRDRWARREDIERVDRYPVALAFTIPANSPIPEPNADGYSVMPMAVAVPPPQLGERAIIGEVDADDIATSAGEGKWMGYSAGLLTLLPDDGVPPGVVPGFTLWRQLGMALRRLNAPAEWWMHSDELERCHDPRQYQAMRETLRSRLLATRSEEREAIREQLAGLEQIRKNAEKLRKAKQRAQQDRAAWLAEWQDVQRMAQELAAIYWRARQTATSVPPVLEVDTEAVTADIADADAPAELSAALPAELSEDANMLAQIVAENAAQIDTPSYAEDRAVREAALAPKATWHTEADIPRYNASNNLAVYFHNPEHPLSLADAQAQLLRVRGGTALTVRIAQGLWNLRRHDAKLGRNGAALIAYNDILRWRGVAKHSRAVSPGSERRVTDGWRTEDREDVRRDFEIASSYYLRGQHTVMYNNKAQTINVAGPYMKVSFSSVPTLWGEEPAGVWFTPGDWINSYEDAGNYYLAEIDRRVFELNPQNEQHELKLALYLTELWRAQARKGRYDQPTTMSELLQRSVINVDRNMLTSRFAPRIENALAKLRDRGIIGAYECLTPVDKSKGKWGQAWLASLWRISPPDALRQSYIDKDITKAPRLGPGPGRPKGKRRQ